MRSHVECNPTSVGVPHDCNRFPDVRVNDFLDKRSMLRYPYHLSGGWRMSRAREDQRSLSGNPRQGPGLSGPYGRRCFPIHEEGEREEPMRCPLWCGAAFPLRTTRGPRRRFVLAMMIRNSLPCYDVGVLYIPSLFRVFRFSGRTPWKPGCDRSSSRSPNFSSIGFPPHGVCGINLKCTKRVARVPYPASNYCCRTGRLHAMRWVYFLSSTD